MGCEWLKTDDGMVIHMRVSNQGGKKKRCPFCKTGKVSKLCDYPLIEGEGRTCDAEMCDACSRTLGRGDARIGPGLSRINDTLDVCPLHRGQAVVVEGKIFAHD